MKATFLCLALTWAFCLGLNVHLVGHTHDDVGWLKTVDQYYYGGNNSIQHAGVQYIINSIIPALEQNPDRKFSYVEQAFFQRWWREQTPNMQQRVVKLVQSGQLELLNGGWCMHDEANPHYVGMIDQTTLGHKFIKDEFNVVPTAGWQIDPFGHSSTQAALLTAEVGLESLWTARIDYQDHNQRMSSKTLEMVWRASPSYGSSADVFFGAFVGHYNAPSGLCFDIRCGDAPIQDNPDLEDYNVPDRVNNFVNQANSYASHIQGNDIMFTLGDDFEWESAYNWFVNLDKLIKAVNADGRVKTFYSTPTMYGRAKLASGIQWPMKTDDFFPYSDGDTSVWSGYFTSRAALKRNIRVSDNLVNVFKQIESFGAGDGSNTQQMWEAASVSQHHDGVAGTSKQHVAYDYAKMIATGATKASAYSNGILKKWLNDSALTLTWCPQLNESVCSISENNRGVGIIIYNPTARARQQVVRVPISNPNVTLLNYKGTAATFQVIQNPASVITQVTPQSAYQLIFIADLVPLGYTTYFTQATNLFEEMMYTPPVDVPADEADSVLANAAVSLTFDGTTGLLKEVQDKASALTRTVNQNFYYWQSADNTGGNPSGAYIFRNRTASTTVVAGTATVKFVTGPVINEAQQSFSNWITQRVQLIGDQRQVEFHYSVGSIPISDNVGKEIISLYASNVGSGSTWYTDSNGREFLTRVKDFRPTWNYKVDQPIAGNYYPVNAAIYVKDSASQLTVLTDRSQGGTSLNAGQVELMVHRRTLHDDGRGVGEPLNETQSIDSNNNRVGPGLGISGTHYMFLTTPSTAASAFRPMADQIFQEPYIAFTPVTNVASFVTSHTCQKTFSSTALPVNVQLLTLTPWTGGTLLVRLSHQFAVNEDAKYSAATTVDLATVINWNISNVTELSLTANQNKATMKRPTYNVKNDNGNTGVRGKPTEIITENGKVTAVLVSLGPMEIKTFSVKATFN